MTARPLRVALAGADGRLGSLCRQALSEADDIELAATLVRGDDPEGVLDAQRIDVLVDVSLIEASRELVPLALERGTLDPTRAFLREHGNLSSASVLFILDRLLTSRRPAPGERGLLTAFGPGFAAELVLLEW